jgi:hypothetical protein
MKRLVIVIAILVLTGCAATERVSARNELLASKATLKTCLAQHPQDVQTCNGVSAAYQADLAAYQAISPSGVMMANGGGVGDVRSQPSPLPGPQLRKYSDDDGWTSR